MRVLVTVGSTKFDALVGAALSQPVLNALAQKGYTHLVIQCGNSKVDELGSRDVEWNRHSKGLNIDVWKFKPNLDEEYDAADLVIGHAGLCSPLFFWLVTMQPMTLGIVQARVPSSMYCGRANPS